MASPIYRITDSLFIDTSSDKATIQHNAVAGSQVVGLSMLNASAGASNAAQFSPAIELVSAGYNTGGSASVTNKFNIQSQNVSGSFSPTGRQGDGYLVIANSYNGGGYATVGSFDGYGNMVIAALASTTISQSSSTTISANWTALTLKNSYAYIGSPWSTPSYTKDAFGFVWLKGAFSASGTANTACATLPAGFRPGRKLRCMTAVNLARGIATIDTNGDIVNAIGSYVDSFFIDWIRFPAEN